MTTVTSDKVVQAGETRRLDTDRIVEKIGEVRDRAKEKVEEVRDRAVDMAKRGKERAVELEGEFEDYVKEHPIQAVSVAAGVGALAGFAVGVLVGRR